MALSDAQSYTGDGSTRTFQVTGDVLSKSHMRVWKDDVIQDIDLWDLLGNVVVFKTAPENSSALEFIVSTTGTDLPANPSDLSTVAGSIDNVNTVANNLTNIDINADNIGDINTLAGISAKLSSLVNDKATLDGLYAYKATLDSIFADKATLDSLFNDKSVLDSLYADKAKLDSLFADKTTLDSLYTDKAQFDAIYANMAEILLADDNATIATTKASEASTSASSASSSASSASTQASTATTQAGIATTQATNASNSATSAATSLDNFEGQYVSQATAPTSPIEGMLWFDETNDLMKVYDGAGFINAGSSVNGTAERQTYVATSGQTTFSATYDAGYVDVYLNGIKLVPTTDFTATDGTTVVLTSGATTGDDVEIVAYGTFELADTYTQAQSDALLDTKSDTTHNHDSDYMGLADAYTKTQSNALSRGFKNYIVNGGFDVWQRGTSASGISSYSSYSADRWKPESGGSGMTMSYNSVPEGIEVSRAGAGTGVIYLVQRIEASSIKKSVGLTMTLSGYVKTTDGLNVDATVYTPSSHATDSWGARTFVNDTAELVQSFSMSGANEWTYVSYTFTVPNDAIYGLAIGLKAAGDTANNIKLGIKNVQLEEGSVATPFEQRPYGLELGLCQRYYETFSGRVCGYSSSYLRDGLPFKVTKRTTPTVTESGSRNSGGGSVTLGVNANSVHGWQFSASLSSYGFSSTLTADAEL